MLASYAVPALSYLPTAIKRLAKTNFTSAAQAADYVLKLVLDREGRLKDAGGKMFAWGLDEVSLPADARNEEYRRELWRRSLALAGFGENGENVPLNG